MVAPTLVKVSITTMRPSRKGNRGARMARTTKNARKRDHGRLLQQCEKAESSRGRSGGRTRMTFVTAW